ncbi:hypothetical protein MABM_30690 [Mycobacteroides abscessus]|nr:hypothetical protein MABM_30690 [Mycobacteroides abscessus]
MLPRVRVYLFAELGEQDPAFVAVAAKDHKSGDSAVASSRSDDVAGLPDRVVMHLDPELLQRIPQWPGRRIVDVDEVHLCQRQGACDNVIDSGL